MGFNTAKLDAIRAKLAASAPIIQVPAISITPVTLIESKQNENQQLQQKPQQAESAGKSAVTNAIVALQASAQTSTTIHSSSSNQESAGTINFQKVADSISELQVAIHGAHPQMPRLLHSIWETLHSYPEQVTLLSEEQAEIVFSGLEKIVNIDLANLTIKAATKSGGKKAPVSSASLGF